MGKEKVNKLLQCEIVLATQIMSQTDEKFDLNNQDK